MSEDSPFYPHRFEYYLRHLYYIPAHIFSKLEPAKPVYLVGSRGTGKTTLLCALNWVERLKNESLERSIGDDAFRKQYIGLYLRMPHFQVTSFENWLSAEKEDLKAQLFAFYLDLIWIELASKALSELILGGEFNANATNEHHLLDELAQKYPEIRTKVGLTRPCTLLDFSEAVQFIRRRIQKVATLGGSPQQIYEDYPIEQVGEFGRSISEVFVAFCNRFSTRDDPHYHFKICIDEAECLSEFQQRVVNTAVRLSKGQAIFVVSYSSKISDMTSTLLPNITLANADRELISLDNMSDTEFEELAEGVATVRVQDRMGDANATFNTRKILGTLSLNRLLKGIIDSSVSTKAKSWLAKAEAFSKTDFYLGVTRHDDKLSQLAPDGDIYPPIYQAYIVEKLHIELPSCGEPRWKRRREDSTNIRKKMVAAYLCLCKELGAKVRYGFAEMVFQMSDKCIRDFMLQINEIFIESGLPIEKFLVKKGISMIKQTAALKRASEQKRDSLGRSGVSAPTDIDQLVHGLAKLTAIVQTRGPENRPLRSTERGKFVIENVYLRRSEVTQVMHLISEADQAGFLRVLESRQQKWVFRVHCSLAAAYGFSYRGAYYETPLSISDLERLIAAEGNKEVESVVEEIGRRVCGEGLSLPLFDGVQT